MFLWAKLQKNAQIAHLNLKKSLFLESLLRILFEEVVIKYHADLLKQACGDVLATEDVVDVGALAVDFTCEPSHWLTSIFQYLFDSLSDVHKLIVVSEWFSFYSLSATKVRKKMIQL